MMPPFRRHRLDTRLPAGPGLAPGTTDARGRLRAGLPIDWPFTTALVLIAGYMAYAFAVVHFGIHDGGQGDDSARLLIAFRMRDDLSSAWTMFLTQPWPPMPYILQVLAGRALHLVAGFSDRQFVQSALLCSVTLFVLHLLVALVTCRRLGSTLAGLLYIVGMISAGSISLLAISAMAEAPAYFFLAVAALLLTMDSAVAVAAAGLMFMAGSLCRSEIAVFGAFTAAILLFRHGWWRSFMFGAISVAAAAVKTLHTLLLPSGGMSYFDLRKFYWLGNNPGQRLHFLLSQMAAAQRIDTSDVTVLALLVAVVLVQGFLVHRREPGDTLATRRVRYALGVSLLGSATVAFLVGLCAFGIISWNSRYQLIPLSITFFGLCLFAAGHDRRSGAWGMAVLGVATVALFFVGASGAFASFGVVEASVPVDLRQARMVIDRLAGPNNLLVVDALAFWDTYPLMHAEIDAGATRSACAYDMPPVVETAGMRAAIAQGHSLKTVDLLGYIDQYQPTILATAGPEWRAWLDSIPRFMDKQERASYILPSITWQSPSVGELKLDKIGSGKRFLVTRIFQSPKVSLYRLTRIKSGPASRADRPKF